VSQILGGGENLTLRTLAALSTALDARFSVDLNPLKAGDTYTSRDAGVTDPVLPQAQPLPPGMHYFSPPVSEIPRRP